MTTDYGINLMLSVVCMLYSVINIINHVRSLEIFAYQIKMAQISSPESPTKLEIEDDIMQYYVVDGVRLPPFCRGKMEEVINFPVREDDVWILSYPRAGSHTFSEFGCKILQLCMCNVHSHCTTRIVKLLTVKCLWGVYLNLQIKLYE